ncbi:hypothetical protein ARAM_001726 [Aspergillus rambellii]|uniref:Tyrosinase copper-binding domain-containing protein n=1 Tax=Aspergillus rambellii TaxID=308745 RepID=A0A0F8URR2_9EURO|nr:hypothetical protein ARAM_001726 [Aspergillus rambellii]
MALLRVAVLALLLTSSLVYAGKEIERSCCSLNRRKSWNVLTDDEKAEYLRAEICLMNHPPLLGTVEGAKSIWDELHHTHIWQGNYVHYVGHFLPWHRYLVRTHELLLQTLCNYTGSHPYWDEIADWESGPLNKSRIFDSTLGFGGNGIGDSKCVEDGPFKNLVLNIGRDGKNASYCLTRDFHQANFDWANSTYLDECRSIQNYTAAWACYHAYPHAAGHAGVGGLMYDPIASNGDPIFYLHHAYMDRLWWKWQQMDLPRRLHDMGGPNVPDQRVLDSVGLQSPSRSLVDYSGDNGNVTTLRHILWIEGLVPNVTVADVMNLHGDVICAEYID